MHPLFLSVPPSLRLPLSPSLFLALICAPPLAAFGDAPVEKLPSVVVNATPSIADKYQLPQVAESITAIRIEETINAIDAEDAVKYLPSVFLRKRNHGDTQAVMATRVWGVSSSARSLVFADGVLLSALIANNNSIGGPRWGLVAPAEIERVDMMYGPFAAAYAGNSMGAVMEITTRMPERFEAALTQTFAFQDFAQYATRGIYRTSQTAVNAGSRAGKFSCWISANHQDSHSQPLSYVTNATFPTGTSGGFAERNKLGAAANVVGASGLLHPRMTHAKFKAAYDFTPSVSAAYTFGLWRNVADSSVETYLTNAAGQPTYAGLAGFASGAYQLRQRHSSHSFAVRTDTKGDFDLEAAAGIYRMDQDQQRTPTTASTTTATTPGFGAAGRLAVLEGTGWSTLDLKAAWHPTGRHGAHVASFGVHDDRYRLVNPTYNTSDWLAGGPITSVATEGDGKTHTQALWVQDVWRVTPNVILTLGARYEEWHAFDGLNVSGTTAVRQPDVRNRGLSPKATLAWVPSLGSQPSALNSSSPWLVTASLGKAYRYATAAELYQLVSTGTTFTSPNPNLKPDDVVAAEFKLERRLDQGRIRVSFFQDDVHDAMIAQFNPLVPNSPTLFSYVSNVDHVRARGIEFVVQQDHVPIRGLEFTGSVTFLSARTLAMSGRASATAPVGAAIGKKLPNIPDWRAAFVATYRPGEHWALTVAGRYSDKLYTTLDEADVNPNTYQGFAAWFVTDARVHYRAARHWSASLGMDNFLNRKYFVFHPFPQRTFVIEMKCSI